MERWHLLDNQAAAAANNMALDEALLQTASARGCPLLRVYRWDKPSVSFGYFQQCPQHLAAHYALVRRPTGGGIVYHGTDTTYTVVVPPGHQLALMRPADAYQAIHRAVAAAVHAELHRIPVASPHGDYECFQNPVAGDVVAQGRKLAGGAQRRTKWGMLHQGSIAQQLSTRQVMVGFEQELQVEFEAFRLPALVVELTLKLTGDKYATPKWNRRMTGSPINSG